VTSKETLFGIVCNDWTVDKIGDIFTLSQGLQIDSKKRIQNTEEGYIPLLKITDLPHRNFSEFVTNIENQHIAGLDDIIYTRTGNVGLVYTDIEGCVHNNCFKVHFEKEKFDKYFVYYYLKSQEVFTYSNQVASGSVQKDLTHPAFKACPFGYPNDLKEQKKIGEILKNFDDKIELNNQMNQTLEDMATELFKEWFENFNFPNSEGKPYKANGGEMKESEVGEIPIDWEVLEIGKVISVKDGTHDSPSPQKEGYPLVTSKHIKNNFLDLDTPNLISEEDYNKVNQRSKVDTNDILIGMIGTVGDIYLVSNEEIRFAIKNVGLFKTSEKIDLYEYIYYWLTTSFIEDYIVARLAGTTQKYISLTELRKLPLVLPLERVIKDFKNLINPILKQIQQNQEQNQILKKQRDTLLPQLMSGKVRV